MRDEYPVRLKGAARVVLGLLLLHATLPLPASAQAIEWVRQFGTAETDEARAVSANGSGIYVAGILGGILPDETSTGSGDAYVRKYDSDGNEVWTRLIGSSEDIDQAIAVAASGSSVYVAGLTRGALPGQSSAGSTDAFVRKYDADSNEVWTRQFGSASGEVASGIFVDGSGVYVIGSTGGAMPGQISAGSADAFVRKYDADGNELWTRQFGSSSNDIALGFSGNASGIYVSGWTAGTLPGQISAGSTDAFVRKYDADGNEVWTRQFGTGFDLATGVFADGSGVYVAGWTAGTLPGQFSAGGADAFVRKYDADGNEVWTRQFGSESMDRALGISGDAVGLYVAGSTNGALPGQTSAGGGDAFVRRYDADGNEVWTHQFGSADTDQANDVSPVGGSLYVAGLTLGALPGQASAGDFDGFVAKLSALTPEEALQALITDVVALNLKQGIANGLDAKLEAVVDALDDVNENNNVAAVNALQAFINSVEAQRGIHISEADATALIAAAEAIIAQLTSP